jgi:hypothetical protein
MTFQTFHISGQKEGLFFWGKVEKKQTKQLLQGETEFSRGYFNWATFN